MTVMLDQNKLEDVESPSINCFTDGYIFTKLCWLWLIVVEHVVLQFCLSFITRMLKARKNVDVWFYQSTLKNIANESQLNLKLCNKYHRPFSLFSKHDGEGNENITKQKNNGSARAFSVFVHFFGVLGKTKIVSILENVYRNG